MTNTEPVSAETTCIDRCRRPVFQSVLAIAIFLWAGCSDGEHSAAPDEELPLIESNGVYRELPPLRAIIESGAVGVLATLTDIVETGQIEVPAGGEDSDRGEELLDLRFRIDEVSTGEATVGDRIVVQQNAYRVDAETKRRTAKLEMNGVGLDSWTIGNRYVLFYRDGTEEVTLLSYQLTAEVDSEDRLLPFSHETLPEFAEVQTLADLRTIVECEVAAGAANQVEAGKSEDVDNRGECSGGKNPDRGNASNDRVDG